MADHDDSKPISDEGRVKILDSNVHTRKRGNTFYCNRTSACAAAAGIRRADQAKTWAAGCQCDRPHGREKRRRLATDYHSPNSSNALRVVCCASSLGETPRAAAMCSKVYLTIAG